MPQRRATYTVEEASSLLGISTSKLYRCIRAGELRGLYVGRRVVIPAPVLEELLGGPVPGAESEPDGHDHEEGLNRVAIVGRLAREPVLKTSRTGMPYATMRLAVTRPGESLQIAVIAFGRRAEIVATLAQGQLVRIDGRLGQWESIRDDGTRRFTHRVVADRIQAVDRAPSQWAAS
jgi:excisionase family DNA binding protein